MFKKTSAIHIWEVPISLHPSQTLEGDVPQASGSVEGLYPASSRDIPSGLGLLERVASFCLFKSSVSGGSFLSPCPRWIHSSQHRRIKKWVLHAEPEPPNFKAPGLKAEVSPCELSHHASPGARESTTGQIEFSVTFHCKMAAESAVPCELHRRTDLQPMLTPITDKQENKGTRSMTLNCYNVCDSTVFLCFRKVPQRPYF